jgi:hypothetical protein
MCGTCTFQHVKLSQVRYLEAASIHMECARTAENRARARARARAQKMLQYHFLVAILLLGEWNLLLDF